jgi:hypothetical protein
MSKQYPPNRDFAGFEIRSRHSITDPGGAILSPRAGVRRFAICLSAKFYLALCPIFRHDGEWQSARSDRWFPRGVAGEGASEPQARAKARRRVFATSENKKPGRLESSTRPRPKENPLSNSNKFALTTASAPEKCA